ncbi:hypothetical protein DFQ28_008954 [Apophysomyces sp. BC1034]|nr:hypothetical protein DFQ29_007612 [Apophysomyces sp. BC1021]KAG0185689.1 hypothetical protein DFQ28_008954 [Apophysomyces sp. BC1034]
MPRTVSLLAGLLAVSALTYKLGTDLKRDTSDIRRRLESAKTTFDHVAAGTANKSLYLESNLTTHKSSLPLIEESQLYVKERLVPSVKESWNAHVTKAAHAVIYSDIPSQAKSFWVKNILGNREDK